MTTTQSTPTKATLKGHGKPVSGTYFGTGPLPSPTGTPVTFRADTKSKGKLYVDGADGTYIAWIGMSSKFWFIPS